MNPIIRIMQWVYVKVYRDILGQVPPYHSVLTPPNRDARHEQAKQIDYALKQAGYTDDEIAAFHEKEG